MIRIIAIILFVFFTGINTQAQLVRYTKMESFTVDQLKARWKSYGIPRFITPVKNGVDIYEVIYKMPWIDGSMVEASGIYFVPQGMTKPVPRLVYNHGTIIKPPRNGFDYNGESTISLMFSADGYAVIAPDYVGLGLGEKQHLYVHADSEANAGIYFMKAVEEINQQIGLSFNDQLFISGYSQGGHSTLALHRKLQNKYKEQYPVTASSPMSGPYDLAGEQSTVMFREYSQPHYLPYLLIGYNTVYNAFPQEDFYDIFAEPYDTLIPKMFSSKKYGVGDINAMLPNIPKDMVKPEFVEQYQNDPDFILRKELVNNSVFDWKPESPVQICYCKGDEEVLYTNALVAHETMEENGAEHITLRHTGKKYNHRDCADFSVVYTKFYFDSFRKGSKKGRKGPIFKRWMVGIAKLFM